MKPSPTQQVRDWLENDLMALVHLKYCREMNYGPEQTSQFLNAAVNGMVFEDEYWDFNPDHVDWKEIGNEAAEIFRKRAQRIMASN